MKTVRRLAIAVVALAILLAVPIAQAQVLKQLPANPIVVVKLNNAQSINDKWGQMANRLGLHLFGDGAIADPLTALKNQFKMTQGLNFKGDAALALYDPGQPGVEPLVIVLLPVADFKGFLGNLANVKQEGEVTSFTLPDDLDPLYVANWGGYAAVTPNKDMLARKPAGVEIAGLASKQLESNDIAAWVDMKQIGAKVLPDFRGFKGMIGPQLDQGLAAIPNVNPKYIPAIKALVNQIFNGVEEYLLDAQSITLGINLTKDGINITFMNEFVADSYIGKIVKEVKNSNGSFLNGLPNRKYFVFGGSASSPSVAIKVMEDFLGPISKELAGAGDDAKIFTDMINSVKDLTTAVDSMSFGYTQPTGALNQQGMVQGLMVYSGDAKKIAEASKLYAKANADLMKIFPQAPGTTATFELKPAAKTYDGITFDEMKVDFKIDNTNPQAAQAGQFISMLYGPKGLTTYSAALNDKTYFMSMGGDEELFKSGVTAAKKGGDVLSELPQIKAVAAGLPANRAVVFYISVDNIASSVLNVMAQFGIPAPLKLPGDMPPIGTAISSEGSALRVDTHISNELIEKAVSAGIQAALMMQGGKKGGL